MVTAKKIPARIRRAVKELLGMPQWPRKIQPKTFEEQIYIAAVRQGDSCYDVGASVGKVSLLLARLVGEKGFVIAFEPLWLSYLKLCSNVQKTANFGAPVVTVPMGLADADKEATIQVPANQFGMGSLAPAANWGSVQTGNEIISYHCRFTTLDTFIKSYNIPSPDFIKIDVEGAELFVLNGAGKIFENGNRPLLLIELFAPWEHAFNYKPWAVLNYLMRLNYLFLFVCPEGLIEHSPTEANPFPPEYEQGYNVLAFHREKHAERMHNVNKLRVGGSKLILSMPPPPVANKLV
jgi:FkbM family methyltransferase